MEIEPTPPPAVQKIFSVKESRVTDGQSIHFDLPTDGVYTLTLIDKESGQVVSRERFNGKLGENIKKIYTNSIQHQYLYMLLEDVTKFSKDGNNMVISPKIYYRVFIFTKTKSKA